MTRAALLVSCALLLSACGSQTDRDSLWAGYEGGQSSAHFSGLERINPENVGKLEVAWTYEVGNTDVSAEPLVLADRLIVAGSEGHMVALDPAKGTELWRTDTGIDVSRARGFSYWKSEDGKEERVLFAAGTSMRAVNPGTGKLIANFEIDLREGLGRDPKSMPRIASSTPGRVFENLIIVGSSTGEDYQTAPGDVRAFDVRSGKLIWSFHTIPHPGEPGHETWPADAWKTAGGANTWGGLSVDDERGIAYFVTGSPTYDFYGADRIGNNLYGNSVVAVDARTGRRLWHFQTVHHDLWDYDISASPVLLTIQRDGKPVPAVAVAGKTGFLYVFDRVTGKPIWPIRERPVPASDVPGEVAAPTQPMPEWPVPFSRQSFTEKDLDPSLSPEERADAIAKLKPLRNEGMFTPPSFRGSIQMPGSHGGANWGMAGANLATGHFYVMSYDLPAVLKLVEGADPTMLEMMAMAQGRGAAVYAANCQLCHGPGGKGQPPAIPDISNVGERMKAEEFQKLIREGRGSMPAFPDIDGPDVQGVLSYLGGAGMRSGPRPKPKPVAAAPTVKPSGAKQYRSSYGYIMSKSGQSVMRPPWQTMTAYDLNSGKRLWQVPIGTVPDRTSPTGQSLSKGGMAITASGLIFAASEADRKLHAFDAKTGKHLWAGNLNSRPRGGLALYEHDRRQFVVVPAANSSGFSMRQRPSAHGAARNAYVAFALPK